MTNEELFDAYREVVNQRDQLAEAGDALWHDLSYIGHWPPAHLDRWKALRRIGTEPPLEDWAEC